MKVEDIYIRNAKVINIVDGDTFDGEVDLGLHIKVKERYSDGSQSKLADVMVKSGLANIM